MALKSADRLVVKKSQLDLAGKLGNKSASSRTGGHTLADALLSESDTSSSSSAWALDESTGPLTGDWAPSAGL